MHHQSAYIPSHFSITASLFMKHHHFYLYTSQLICDTNTTNNTMEGYVVHTTYLDYLTKSSILTTSLAQHH